MCKQPWPVYFYSHLRRYSLGRGTLLRRDPSLSRVTRWPTARTLSGHRRGCFGHRCAPQKGDVPGATPQRSPAPRRARLGGGRPLGRGSPGSRARPRSPPQAARPARSPPCSGYRLGSALVDAALGRRAARHRPIGGRSGVAVAGGVARSGKRSSLRARVGPR